MLVIVLWAYQTIYKMTTQYTPFESIYNTQPIMPVKFAVPTKRVHDLPQEDLDKAIRIRVEDLFGLDETFWHVGENINHIQLLHKEQTDDQGKIKKFKGELVLWMLKTTKNEGR